MDSKITCAGLSKRIQKKNKPSGLIEFVRMIISVWGDEVLGIGVKVIHYDMKKLSKYFVVLLLLLASIAVGIWKYSDGRSNAEDYTYIKQLIESIAETGVPSSDAQNAINDMLFDGVLTTPPEELCVKPLAAKSHMDAPFAYHPYFILYIIAPLANLLSAELLLALITVGGFFLLLYFNFSYMQSQKVGVFISLCLLLLFTVHPVWSQALQGQYYVERFFIPLAAWLIWLINRDSRNFSLIFLVTILCVLVTERTGLIVGAYLIMHALIYRNIVRRERLFLLVFGVLSLSYSASLMTFYLDNASYSSGGFFPHNLSELFQRFTDDAFVSKLGVFSFYNLLVLGLFAVWDWRAFSIALVMMLPNMVGNIGGAEKTGFLTHYHSLYLPFLFWAASSGTVKLYHQLLHTPVIIRRGVVVFMSVFLIPMVAFSGVSAASRIDFSSNHLNDLVIVKAFKQLPECFDGGAIAQWRKGVDDIRSAVPEGVKVTTSFWGMPILEHNRSLYYYPLGLDVADYAVLRFQMKNGSYYYTGAISYLGADAQNAIDQCMNLRLREVGFNVDDPLILGGTAILKRGGK